MANMSLGTYTFEANPSDIDGIVKQKVRSSSAVDTYTGVAFFTWGLFYAGKTMELSWDYMSTAQYEAIRALYEADAAVVFDPQDGYSPATTYNVEIRSLSGSYHLYLDDETGYYRRDVRMELLVLGEVT